MQKKSIKRTMSWEMRIPQSNKILEVGSGGFPNPKSTYLCDKSLTGEERSGSTLALNKPFVLGDGEKLPFKSGSFDYSICIHVIEHSDDPGAFIDELMRVSKKGYIETPSLLWEKMQPWREFHKWFIFDIDEKLVFIKKEYVDRTISVILEKLVRSSMEISLLRNAFKPVLNVGFEWDGKINYQINPENANELISRWSDKMVGIVDDINEGGHKRRFFKNMIQYLFRTELRRLKRKLRRILKRKN